MKIESLKISPIYGFLIAILCSFLFLTYIVFFSTIPNISLRANYYKSILEKVMQDASDVFLLLEKTSFQEVSEVTTTEDLQKTIDQKIRKQHDILIGPGLVKEVQVSFFNVREREDLLKKNVYGFSYTRDNLILKLPIVGVRKGSFQVNVVYNYKKVLHSILQRSLSNKYRAFFTRSGFLMVSLQKENLAETVVQDIGKSIETPCYGTSAYFFRGQNVYGICEVLLHVDRSVIFLYPGGLPIPIASQILFGILFVGVLSLLCVCYKDIYSRGESIFFHNESLPEVPLYLYEKKGIPVNKELHMLIDSIMDEKEGESFLSKREVSKETVVLVGRNILQKLFWVDVEGKLLDQVRQQITENADLHYMVLRNQGDEYVVTENEGFSKDTEERFRFSSRAKIVSLLENGKKLIEIDNHKQDSQFLQEKLGEKDIKTHPTLLCIPFAVNKILHAIICIG